jgi:hypothetical protein
VCIPPAGPDKGPFEDFSQVFRLILRFWIVSEVVYEKKDVLLLFNVIFFYIFKVNFELM